MLTIKFPLKKSDKLYTAFGMLREYNSVSLGTTSGVQQRQRVMHNFVEKNGPKETFSYLDDVTLGESFQKELNEKESGFLQSNVA